MPALFLASLPPGLEQSPSPFMSTTGRAHAAPSTRAASHPQEAVIFLSSIEAPVKNSQHGTGTHLRLPLTFAADIQ